MDIQLRKGNFVLSQLNNIESTNGHIVTLVIHSIFDNILEQGINTQKPQEQKNDYQDL